MDARQEIAAIGDGVRGQFVEQRSLLSFHEFLELFERDPRAHARSAAQWLRDVFDAYGREEVRGPAGTLRRFRLFDLEFAPEWRAHRVVGHEDVQAAIYRALGNFVRTGRVNKLILLHGPNGSAKSSIVGAIVRAMEAYSRRPEGALYRFAWLFPSDRRLKGGMGFGPGGAAGDLETYAHLEGEDVAAKLACPMKDHPLFLIPVAERRRLLERHCRPSSAGEAGEGDFVLSEYVADGELCHFCQPIYAALLAAHRGDWLKVLRHVEVERFYVSSRYQQAAVTVEPQLSVDAAFRQITADRTLASLPPALHALALHEATGPIVGANRGLLEYADLLKRPIEAFKYLLGLGETGRLSVGGFQLHLDAVLLASANEQQLAAFRDGPTAAEFQSFKGRLELVRVPYLRLASVERRIYDQQVTRATAGRHVAPHATEVAALWAVLTRLEKPALDRYPDAVRELVAELTPIEKLRLYDQGEAPDRLGLNQARELKKNLEALYRETESVPLYEGRVGASARELKTALFNAAQVPRHRCLTPMAVLEELEALCRERAVHDFLQQERVDGYHDADEFVRVVEGELLDALDEEIRDSMGLVTESQYRELFGRYITQVSSWVKGEKVRNRVTGEYAPPDEERMVETERIVMHGREDAPAFRRGLISAIGAYRLDHPDAAELDFAAVFPDLFRRMREHYYEERKRQLRHAKENLLRWFSGEQESLEARARREVERTLGTLRERYAYCESCAEDAIRFLLARRYE